jgi:CRP/FNR family transcriptional regulator, cyclic AMP receptor protein
MEVTDSDLLGYAAAILVLATFCIRSMNALRWVAIASNLTFIAYACSARLAPVLLLHALLLPINVIRLLQQSRRAESLQRDASPEIS